MTYNVVTTVETFGEDPYMMSRLVVAMVNGAQQNNVTSQSSLQAGMCCKHFAAYDVEGGAGTNDRFTFNATVGGRDLFETYLPAFKACTVEASATHVMCSFNGNIIMAIIYYSVKFDDKCLNCSP